MQIVLGMSTTILAILLSVWLAYKYAKSYVDSTHFVCSYCQTAFKLSKLDFMFALKTGVQNERIVTCPYCGCRGKMTLFND